MDDFKKLLDNNLYNEYSYMLKQKSISTNEFIKRALESLKIEDEMVILNTLNELCSELSMANDNLAEDPNCHNLIKELIILLDKYYMLPDVGITSLNCLNYLLDINPRYTSIITKWNGIPKIVKMIQNFEYLECAETVIKSIEKMSYENPYVMIENDSFSALLNLMDFCDLGLRKIALKACVNMTNCINNQDFIKKFIMPSIPNLSNLARFSGNSELEKTILDLSVQCIYNIILSIKNYNLNNNMTQFYKLISEHGILENLYDIFLRFLRLERESVYDDESLFRRKSSFGNINPNSNSSNNNFNNSNVYISLETFKNIIKLFDFFCSLSADVTNGILNMNILNVIYYILVKELGLLSTSAYKKSLSQSQNSANDFNLAPNTDKNKIGSNSHGYFIEIFNLLISLFPNKASKGKSDRLLAEENKKFFIYFSEKILCLIINNIVNIPSSNSMVQIFKLMEMYIQSSPAEYILKYIDPIKFSNIANKMLDSKDSSYILQVFSVVEIIMSKTPSHFIVSFIREGVMDNIKNLIDIEETKLYFPADSHNFFKEMSTYSEQIASSMNISDDEIIDDSEILFQENDTNFKTRIENIKILKKSYKKENNKIEILNRRNLMEKKLNENPNENPKSESIENFPDEKILGFLEKNKTKNEEKISLEKSDGVKNTQENLNLMENKNQEISTNTINTTENSNSKPKMDPIVLKDSKPKKTSLSQGILSVIHIKATEISGKFFTEENIDTLLRKENIKNNPSDIIKRLIDLKEMLKTPENFAVKVIMENIVNNLFCEESDSPTFYEIEKSEVILYLSKYIDENFITNLDNTTECDAKTTSILSDKYNFGIIEKLKGILQTMDFNLNKIKSFLSSLQQCISSMNCFKLYIYDISNIKNYSPNMLLSSLRNTTQKIFVKFNYSATEEKNGGSKFSEYPLLDSIAEIINKNENLSNEDLTKIINDSFNIQDLIENSDELKLIKQANEFFKTLKSYPISLELNENLNSIKDFFMKLKISNLENNTNTSNNLFMSRNSGKEDIFEEIMGHYSRRKSSNSEDDENLPEKFLRKLMERKTSIEIDPNLQNENEEENENENNNEIENNNNEENLDKEKKNVNNVNNANKKLPEILDQKSFNEKIDFLFYATIKDEIFIVNDKNSIMSFLRELKNKVKKGEYINYANDIQLYFKIFFKNKNNNIADVIKNSTKSLNSFYDKDDDRVNENWNFSNISNELSTMEKIKYFSLFKNTAMKKLVGVNKINTNNDKDLIILDDFKISNYKIDQNFEEVLFEKYYFECIVNNAGLYCIKRAAPFLFLISLFELAINNFTNIFPTKYKEEDFGLRVPTKDKLESDVLQNMKVTSLLFKQIKDPYAVSNMSIPSWCKDLIYNFTYLSGFNSRYLLFKITSFDTKRAISNLFIYLKNYLGENVVDEKNLATAKRAKFRVNRNNVIENANVLMNELANYTGYIEYEYIDETGTGLGPTLEFYNLCFNEIISRKNYWYKTTSNTLFPSPVFTEEDRIEKEKTFMILGFLIARALYDDRLIDIPLNSLFWDLALDRPVTYSKIELIDKDLHKGFSDFIELNKEKQELLSTQKNLSEAEINKKILYNGMNIEDIGLTFNVPGYSEYELKPRGSDILLNANNIEEYVTLSFDKLCLSGIYPIIKSFKNGFNKVFNIDSLKCFTNTELEEVICGCEDEIWDYDNLLDNIIPDHGFDKNSLMYQGLLQVMLEMNKMEKKSFLQFTTGSPRLPLGGFKNLSPKLTVVLKKMVDENDNPNGSLPTVMTCQKNMKIPNYSNVEILKEKLFFAMYEGNNSFHLS